MLHVFAGSGPGGFDNGDGGDGGPALAAHFGCPVGLAFDRSGALFVADHVISHADTLDAYVAARQADPTLESVTLPLDRGLELSVVLRDA